MRDELEKKLARFDELERQLSDPVVLADGSRVANIARERGSLARLANKYRQFKDLNQEISEALELAKGDDGDMRHLAEAELPDLRARREKCWDELLDMTAGGDDADRSKCIMEIRAGTGGEEAALWARDLYEMYKKLADRKGWKIEIMDLSPTELAGFKEVIVGVEGDSCFRTLQYESGGHRVQRVPATEAKGRIQTSMATVAVMAEPEEVEIDIKPEDYRKDIYCASGPGGQHVNKTASAIRLTHYETNIVVTCQDERSQHKNFAKAMRVLKTRLYEHMQAAETKKRSDHRKSLVGSGDRSEKIRTYNYPDNRITDHRIGFSIHKLDQVLMGFLDPVSEALLEYDRQQQRQTMAIVE